MPRGRSYRFVALAYAFIAQRDGEKCSHCEAPPPVRFGVDRFFNQVQTIERLDVDHIDNDKDNWDPANLQLLCRACNTRKENGDRQARPISSPSNKKKSPDPTPPYLSSASIRDQDSPTVARFRHVDPTGGGPILHLNAIMEAPFRAWLLDYLEDHLTISRPEALRSGAAACGCSIQAARGYLDKLVATAFEGPCMLMTHHRYKGKHITLRAKVDLLTDQEYEPAADEAEA